MRWFQRVVKFNNSLVDSEKISPCGVNLKSSYIQSDKLFVRLLGNHGCGAFMVLREALKPLIIISVSLFQFLLL